MPGLQLFATDLDGTLLRSDLSVSDRTRGALARAHARGVEVVFVTGRPPRWMQPVIDQTGHVGTAIAANGAAVLDLAERLVVHTSPIHGDVILDVVRRLRSIHPGFGFAVEQVRGSASAPHPLDTAARFAHDPQYRPKWVPPVAPDVAEIEQLIEGPPTVKLLARAPSGSGHNADSLLAEANLALSGLVEATHSNSADLLLEMSSAGVTKATALGALAAQRGVSRESVVAVGDMPNDVPMLTWAGRGFAVAAAHATVLAAVGPSRVIGSNDEDAVAELLDRLLGN